MSTAKTEPVSLETKTPTREEFAAHQKSIRTRELWLQSGVPARHRNKKNSDFKEAVEWYETYTKLKEKIGSGFMAALVGGRGNGKTQMVVELIRCATLGEKSALYVEAMDFFIDVKESYRQDSDMGERRILAKYVKPDLLIVDEFGKRGETPWADNLMFYMLNKRYNDGNADTIIIDNRSKTDFTTALGPSLASRMQETGWLIECNWGSFR